MFSVYKMPRLTRNSQDSLLTNDAASAGFSTADQTQGPAAILSPEVLAAIVQAVKAWLVADKAEIALQSSSSATQASENVSVNTGNGGVPTSDLITWTSAHLTSGMGFSSNQPGSLPSSSSGMHQFIVPSYVNTFAGLVLSIQLQSTLSNPGSGVAASASNTFSVGMSGLSAINVAGSSALPILQQPSLWGHCGFSPVPAKIVSQITAGKYVDLSELLSINITRNEPETQLLFEGLMILTTNFKKPRKKIEDIVSWVEAFSIFSMIVTAYFPHCGKDLLQYKLLTLRTYRQFSGRVWLSYDQAFREHAAAIRLTDWSSMNVQLSINQSINQSINNFINVSVHSSQG